MLDSYLCYSTETIYTSICEHIAGRGYTIKKSDDKSKELVVTRWFFPFVNRKFNIKVIAFDKSICNISVMELGKKDIYTFHANHLHHLLMAFF